MSEGTMIPLDSPFAQKLGFTSDNFSGYLWHKEKEIIISLITSHHEGKGNVRKLIQTIIENGYSCTIPTPSNRMIKIARELGFVGMVVFDDIFGRVEVLHRSAD